MGGGLVEDVDDFADPLATAPPAVIGGRSLEGDLGGPARLTPFRSGLGAGAWVVVLGRALRSGRPSECEHSDRVDVPALQSTGAC